jgi:hypothetical protein
MTAYLTGRVWELEEGAAEADLLVLLEEQIAPRYADLHPEVHLGLLRIAEGRYLATQRWPDRDTHAQATQGEAYERWLARYQPVLMLWHALARSVSEHEADELR